MITETYIKTKEDGYDSEGTPRPSPTPPIRHPITFLDEECAARGWTRELALPKCHSGRHTWFEAADAAKCCNGWHRQIRLSEVGGKHCYGYVWCPDSERPSWMSPPYQAPALAVGPSRTADTSDAKERS